MSNINTEDFKIKLPEGNIHVKKWVPERTAFDMPVVLLHDSLGSIELWRNFPGILAENLSRIVIAYDRLGFGKSDSRNEQPPLHFIEEEAIAYFPLVKSGLSISGYILLGHSVGGAMSINIASRDTACKGVITIAAQAFVEKNTIQGIKNAKRGFEQPGQIERLKKWHDEKAMWVLKAWTDIWLSPEFSDWSLKSCIGKIVCPVLAIHGDKDEFGSSAFPEFIAGKTGGVSKMLIFENCGHMPHKEKSSEVINAIKGFLATNGL